MDRYINATKLIASIDEALDSMRKEDGKLPDTEDVDELLRFRSKLEAAPEAPKTAEAAAPEPTSEPEQPSVTVEQVREKLKQISKAGKQPQVKALIESFGAAALSEVPADKLADLLVKAEAL